MMSQRLASSSFDAFAQSRGRNGPSHARSVSRASTAGLDDDAPPTESLRQRGMPRIASQAGSDRDTNGGSSWQGSTWGGGRTQEDAASRGDNSQNGSGALGEYIIQSVT